MQKDLEVKGVCVVYATETGTAQDLAKEFVLVNQGRMKISSFRNISEIQYFDPQHSQQLWIFFVSTTGQGDFPYTMRTLWKKMLTKNHPSLNWMKFTIFSLGDRSYGDNFCMAARKFRQRLISLQAHQVVEIGLGDEQQPNGYFYEYREKWLPNLTQYLQLNNLLLENQQTGQKQTQIKFNLVDSRKAARKQGEFELRVLRREEICSNKDRRVFGVEIEIVGYPQKIELGDILSIYPDNNPADVKYLQKYFNLNENNDDGQNGSVNGKNEKKSEEGNQRGQNKKLDEQSQNGDEGISKRELLQSYLNVSSTLNHSFFVSREGVRDLSNYCKEPMMKEKLVELEHSYDEYHNYIRKYKRNVVEVIQDFQIENLPFQEFLHRASDIIPRKYSIAQVLSNSENKKVVKLIFKQVKTNLNENRVYHGICSNDLALWSPLPSTKRGSILKGDFQYKQKPSNNLVMITLGTGIAPFMQFMDQAKNSSNKWNIILFYTNRHQNQSYFQSLLEQLVAEDKLNPFLSFTGEGGKRIIRFVEDNCQVIRDMMEKVGLEEMKIMVCGPKQVCEGMENILGRELGVDMKMLKKKKIFMYQNW